MRVQVGRLDPHRPGHLDLCFEFDFNFPRVHVSQRFPDGVEISKRVNQRRHVVLGGDGTPPVWMPFRRESQMKAEIGFGLAFRKIRNLLQPGTGNHDTGRINLARRECIEGSDVDGMRNADIIGMDN